MPANTKIFNLQSFKVLNYLTKALLGEFRTIASLNIALAPELAVQKSGPSLFDIETEVNMISSEATINVGEYNKELVNILMDSRSSVNSVASGLVKDIINRVGDLFGASGLAIESIALTGNAEIKAGRYRLELVDKTNNTFNLIALSSSGLKHADYSDRDNSVVESVNLADGAGSALSIGVTATGKASIDLTNANVGDAVEFQVFPEGSISETIDVGQEDLEIPKVSIVALSRNMSDGRWVEIDAPNCIFPGLTLNMGGEFSQSEITGKIIYDRPTDKLLTINTFQR